MRFEADTKNLSANLALARRQCLLVARLANKAADKIARARKPLKGGL